jgi:hypothetical protein
VNVDALTHVTIQITLDRYAHLFPSVDEALGEQLDALYHASPASAESNVAEFRRARQEG